MGNWGRWCWLALALLLCRGAQAQPDGGMLQRPVTLALQDATLDEALSALGRAAGVALVYSPDHLPQEARRTASYRQAPLGEVLSDLLEGTGLVFVLGQEVISVRRRAEALGRASQQAGLGGYVRNAANGEALIGAHVYLPALRAGATTNAYGYYSLAVPPGTYQVLVGAYGYTTRRVTVLADSTRQLHLSLHELSAVLDSVEIQAEGEAGFVWPLEAGRLDVDLLAMEQTPAFLGEFDPVKTLQLYPGVQSGSEGNTGLFVRGGGGDQNLILMDETPIYNAAHLLGFFSTFNADAIKGMTLYKSAMPARYGGRLSSILDIRLREGNAQRAAVSGGIGSISSRLTLESPFGKGRGTLLLSGRRTYLDLLLKAVPASRLPRNDLFFYDLNAKATYQLGSKHQLSLSLYSGRDDIRLQGLFGTRWGTQTATLRWNALLLPKLFSNVTAYLSNFSVASEVNLVAEQFGYLLNYDLRDMGLKQDLAYYHSARTCLEAGYSVVRHRYLFGEIRPSGPVSLVDPQQLDPSLAVEWAAYASWEQELAAGWTLRAGMRWSAFDNMGEASVLVYDRLLATTPGYSLDQVADTLHYGKGRRYHRYSGLEPRLSFHYSPSERHAWQWSYGRTRQYIHQLTNTNTPSPVDMWAPVNPYIPPQVADQLAMGYTWRLGNGKYEAGAEAYWKRMRNQIDFKPQASLFLNNHLETEVLQGDGRAYGLEFLFRKSQGRLRGWASYTLSKAERQIDGINRNRPYPTSFDRRHNFATVWSYQASDRVEVSANWVYASGIAYTFPVGKYQIGDYVLPYYTSRNGFRLEPVHRLNLSVRVLRERRDGQRNASSFVFSVYNAYARKNTYAYVFRQAGPNSAATETVKLYLFSIVPSFTYNFKF